MSQALAQASADRLGAWRRDHKPDLRHRRILQIEHCPHKLDQLCEILFTSPIVFNLNPGQTVIRSNDAIWDFRCWLAIHGEIKFRHIFRDSISGANFKLSASAFDAIKVELVSGNKHRVGRRSVRMRVPEPIASMRMCVG